MVDPFGEISFLARSENRVEVLTTLAEDAYTERELVDETDISDVTVGRVLEDFAERGWIDEDGGTYRASRIGAVLAEDYRRLEESMDMACRLGPVREYLPVAEMGFDLRHLAEGRISDPEGFEPFRAIDRWKQLLRGTDRIVGMAPAPHAATMVAGPFHEAATEGDLSFASVVSRGYYETAVGNPEMRTLLREMILAGSEFYLAPEDREFTYSIALFDDVATMAGYDDGGTLRVGIESRADPVREWVRDTYEDYREDARALTPEDFEG